MIQTLKDNQVLLQFKKLILDTCGFHLEMGREQSLMEGVSKRMHACGINRPELYHALLISKKEELNCLVELLTVNETYFFREPDHLNLVIEKLLPELLAKRPNQPVRILSAGCSTGEEPYSIAMMLHEKYGADMERLFAIIGVDIDSNAISAARNGSYGKTSFRGMEKERLDRYFQPCGAGEFRVNDFIQRQVRFEIVNLLDSSYPQAMLMPDIIFYRNVSIYFPGQVQREIFKSLAGLLSDGGSLMVGATETFHHNIGILALVEQESLFYYRKNKIALLLVEERRKVERHPLPPTILKSSSRATVLTGAAANARINKIKPLENHKEQSPYPRDVHEEFDRALKLARNRQEAEALDILDLLIAQDAAFIKAHTLKGSLLLSAARFDEAASVCEHVIGRDSLCLEAYLMLGLIARQQGNDEDAFRRFREAIYLNASCWLAHFYSAEIMLARNDLKRARKSYETTAQILEKGSIKEHGQAFFPLSVNAEQFTLICRHKLSLLKEK